MTPLVCSARACRAPAEWAVVWNNPKVHRPARRKVWLACPEHQEQLTTFVQVRGFLLEVKPVSELTAEEG